MRALLAALLVFGGIGGAVVGDRPALRATTCSIGPPFLEEAVAGADVVALVEVLAVGGRENTQPTVPPEPTLTPTATATPATPPPTLAPFKPSSTPVPAQPFPAREPIDLTGIGARARILTGYVGPATGEIDLDAATRLDVEIAARKAEALPPGVTTPCPVTLLAARFEVGGRYFIIAADGGRNVKWYTPVEGERGAATIDAYFMLPRATYDRFFPPAPPEYYTDDGSAVSVGPQRIPLGTMISIIADLRGDPIITPPNTGTAGIR